MFETPKAEDLLEDAREAVLWFRLQLSEDDLAGFVAANWNDPAAARRDARLEAAFNRMFARWHLRRDRHRAAADLENGWPFAAFELFSQDSCRLAQDQLGAIYLTANELPHLPFERCPANHCRCSILGLSSRQLAQR